MASGGIPGYHYKWTTPHSDTTAVVLGVTNGAYFVLVRDANNCSLLKSDTVPCMGGPDVPCLMGSSLITPNQDGKNDFFELHRCDGNVVTLEVYNRWGQLVYKNDNYASDSWTGVDQSGNLLPEGAYFYVTKSNTAIMKGSVAIVRSY